LAFGSKAESNGAPRTRNLASGRGTFSGIASDRNLRMVRPHEPERDVRLYTDVHLHKTPFAA